MFTLDAELALKREVDLFRLLRITIILQRRSEVGIEAAKMVRRITALAGEQGLALLLPREAVSAADAGRAAPEFLDVAHILLVGRVGETRHVPLALARRAGKLGPVGDGPTVQAVRALVTLVELIILGGFECFTVADASFFRDLLDRLGCFCGHQRLLLGLALRSGNKGQAALKPQRLDTVESIMLHDPLLVSIAETEISKYLPRILIQTEPLDRLGVVLGSRK